MSKGTTSVGGLTIGLDLGDRYTEGRVLDASGEVIESFRRHVVSDPGEEVLAS